MAIDHNAAGLYAASRRLDLTRHRAPPDVSERVIAATLPPPSARPRPFWRGFAWAASLGAVAILSSAVTYATLGRIDREATADAAISGHLRAMMTGHVTDVTSRDQHTVKPWFAGKLDLSPPVVDLEADGFPLAGGRLDYLDRRPVAALVYRHHQHLIDLFVAPARDAATGRPIALRDRGYNAIAWVADGWRYWAVSDLNPNDLAAFSRLLGAP